MNQKQYRILIVEDDKAIRTLIETALEDAQIAAISAYNGASAISQVRTQNPDVILLDLGLPDMDGIQVVDSLRDHEGFQGHSHGKALYAHSQGIL